MKKVFKTLGSVLTAILFFLCIVVIVKSTVAAKQNRPAFFFGYAISTVVTESMEPTIMVGDIIIYKQVDISEVQEGDVIVFRSLDPKLRGGAVTHRVIRTKYEYGDYSLTTKGDNNDSEDWDPVTSGNFYGKVVTYGSFFGLGKLIKNGRGILFILVITGFLVLALMEVKSIYLHIKANKEEELKNKMKEELLKELEEEGIDIKNDEES